MSSRLFHAAMAVGLIALFSGSSCPTEDPPIVNDEEEIKRYIENSSDGRELFATDGLITSELYQLPGSPWPMVDSVQGVSRLYAFQLQPVDSLATFPGFGTVRHGVVSVTDIFTVRRTIFHAGDSIEQFTETRRFERSAFLLKLGSDFDPYLGWLAWGFNGFSITSLTPPYVFRTTALRVEVAYTRSDNNQSATFAGDSYDPFPPLLTSLDTLMFRVRCRELRDIATIAPGSLLRLESEQASLSTSLRYRQLLTSQQESGTSMQPMTQIDDITARDTIDTPATSSRLWNLIVVQAFDTADFVYRQGWVIPYKIPQ